jgi:uncharacterized protein YceK
MTHRLDIAVLLSVVALVAGCASVHSSQAPEAALSNVRTIYVQKLSGEDWGADKLIVTALETRGYKASSGLSPTPPDPVDATLTYEDKWWWDMSPYLIRLKVQMRDPSNGAILARAESYRPSLERKSPEFMINEVLDQIFGKQK